MRVRGVRATVVTWLMLAALPLAAQETITRGANLSADVAHDGRVAIDLVGSIWIVPHNGGEARQITDGFKTAQRPRWSPDASRIAFQAVSEGSQKIWVHDFTSGASTKVSRDSGFDLYPNWHPGGERIVYSSGRNGTGLDLWEVDLPTGLHWRLSSRNGDEVEAAWSADGRHLVYVHREDDEWSVVLRRHGRPEEILFTTEDRLAGPSWRPDGSLITFFRSGDSGTTIEMAILSEPHLVRTYADGEQYVLAPVSWLDKQRMIYTAGGRIRQRLFNSWSSSPLPFRAMMQPAMPAVAPERRSLPLIDEPGGRLVVHAARMFDGLGGGYRTNIDIVIEGGHIAAVENHSDRNGEIVIDLGDLVVMPGYIDAHTALPATVDDHFGALLLTTGVTTIVTDHDDATRLNTLWSGKDAPGPRTLARSKWPAAAAPAIADALTPGLEPLLDSRQARLIGNDDPVARRFAQPPSIDTGRTSVVLGSRENGLPPGIAAHAEFRAQAAAGMAPEQTLRAAGVNAAAALGVDPYLGRIAVGAAADLVFVDGDPLADIADTLKVVAIVRNGRFFSIAGLIDRAAQLASVE